MYSQALRRSGDLAGALDAVRGVVQRNARAPNAWLQKARLELELHSSPDTVLATLASAVANGEDKARISSFARGIAQTTFRDSTVGNQLEPAVNQR